MSSQTQMVQTANLQWQRTDLVTFAVAYFSLKFLPLVNGVNPSFFAAVGFAFGFA